MVLISGTNKRGVGQCLGQKLLSLEANFAAKCHECTRTSVSQHQNVAQGITAQNIPYQQGINNVDSTRPQNLYSTGLTKVMETLDEFKDGFPSQGLATVSNQWWGNSDTDDGAGINQDEAEVDKHGEDQLKEKATEVDKEASKTGKDDINVGGAAVLTAVRKRAAEEGREVLKLGVFGGYGAKKLSKRERILLLNIFQDIYGFYKRCE